MTWHLINWRVLALRTIVEATVGISRPSLCEITTNLKLGRSKICQNMPAVAYQEAPWHIAM
jgi:hypothetical protein